MARRFTVLTNTNSKAPVLLLPLLLVMIMMITHVSLAHHS